MLLWQPGGEKGAKIQGCILLAWRQPALLVPAQLPPAASFPPSQCWDFLWAPLLGTFAYTPLPKARQSPSTGVGCPLAGRVSVGKRSPGSRFPLCKVGMSFKWEAKEKHIFGNPHLLALPTRSLWFVAWEVSSLAVLLDASPTTGILKLTLSCTSSARGLPRTP